MTGCYFYLPVQFCDSVQAIQRHWSNWVLYGGSITFQGIGMLWYIWGHHKSTHNAMTAKSNVIIWNSRSIASCVTKPIEGLLLTVRTFSRSHACIGTLYDNILKHLINWWANDHVSTLYWTGVALWASWKSKCHTLKSFFCYPGRSGLWCSCAPYYTYFMMLKAYSLGNVIMTTRQIKPILYLQWSFKNRYNFIVQLNWN